MKKLITLMTFALGYFLAVVAAPLLGVAAPLGEVAIFIEQVSWIDKDIAAAESRELADLLKSPKDVVILTDNEIGPWAEEHTDNGQSDIIITFGWFPTTLYPPGNAKPEGSVAENFLEGGNILLNTGDYFFYVTEGGGVNGANGLKNMMDIDVDQSPGEAGSAAIEPTDDGKKYTPSLAAYTTHRPFKQDQIVDPWEVEIVFGDNGAGHLDPVIVRDTQTDGRIGIALSQWNNNELPRGEVFAEMIDNYLADVLGGIAAVDPNKKVTTTWAHIKSDF